MNPGWPEWGEALITITRLVAFLLIWALGRRSRDRIIVATGITGATYSGLSVAVVITGTTLPYPVAGIAMFCAVLAPVLAAAAFARRLTTSPPCRWSP